MTSLVKATDKFVADHAKERMAAFVVLLAENTADNQKKLTDLAEQEKISIPLCLQGLSSPGGYDLNEKADVTALVARSKRVKANIVLTQPAPKDQAAIKTQVDSILGEAIKLLEKS